MLDTSVAVKFYLPEDLRDEALLLLSAWERGAVRLLAPSTIQPELFNALWQQHRRGRLSVGELREVWESFSATALDLYAPEDLMPRAAALALETGVIIYDALFLTLAEDADTVVVTADRNLIRPLEGGPYAHLASPLEQIDLSLPA